VLLANRIQELSYTTPVVRPKQDVDRFKGKEERRRRWHAEMEEEQSNWQKEVQVWEEQETRLEAAQIGMGRRFAVIWYDYERRDNRGRYLEEIQGELIDTEKDQAKLKEERRKEEESRMLVLDRRQVEERQRQNLES
jgi:hypothetical protein